MAVSDIIDCMDSYYRRRKRELKERLSMLFLLAENTAEQIGAFLSKDIHPRKPWDVFPELFKEEAELYQRAEQERQVRQMVENRKAYAAELKRRRETAGLS